MTSWRPTLPWNSQQKPLKKGRNPKGKDRLTTFRHPFLGAEMLVLGRLTTKKYAQVKLDHFPKQGWKFKKCLKPPPSNKQQTIPQKKQVWQREGLDLDPFFFPFEVPVTGIFRKCCCLFYGMICTSFTLWIALRMCIITTEQEKHNVDKS